jgi:hypothetical protein
MAAAQSATIHTNLISNLDASLRGRAARERRGRPPRHIVSNVRTVPATMGRTGRLDSNDNSDPSSHNGHNDRRTLRSAPSCGETTMPRWSASYHEAMTQPPQNVGSPNRFIAFLKTPLGITLIVLVSVLVLCCGAAIVGAALTGNHKPVPVQSSSTSSRPPASPTTTTPTSSTTSTAPPPSSTAPSTTMAPPPAPTTSEPAAPPPAPPNNTATLPVVHPGAFCSEEGALGVTSSGTPMRCTTTPTDSRLRWRSA